MASSTRSVLPGRSPSLVGAWLAASSETGIAVSSDDLAGFQTLEQHVERHDLGERGRMARAVRGRLVQDRAGLGVDHDRGVGRVVARGGFAPLDVVAFALARVGWFGGGREEGYGGGEA